MTFIFYESEKMSLRRLIFYFLVNYYAIFNPTNQKSASKFSQLDLSINKPKPSFINQSTFDKNY